MIGQWLSRWRSVKPRAEVRADATPPRRAVPRQSPSTSSTNPAAGAQGSWLVARRPLLDRSGGIAGWDLQLSTRASERLARPDTPRVLREAYWFALAQAARETTDAGRRVLIGLPTDALGNSAFLDQLPARS